jgi:hypothetical protein
MYFCVLCLVVVPIPPSKILFEVPIIIIIIIIIINFLDNRHSDGGEVVAFTKWLLFTSMKIPGTHFC